MKKQTSSVFTLLYVDDPQDPKILLIQRNSKQGWSVPSSKIHDIDAYSATYAAARTIINKVGNVDVRDLSFQEQYDYSTMVNWKEYEAIKAKWNSEQHTELIQLLRNPFTYMWQKLFTNSFIWNDDEEHQFIYFVPIQESDFLILKQQANQGTELILQPLSRFSELNLSTRTEQFVFNFKLPYLLESKIYQTLTKTFIYIGFKVPGSDKFTPPRAFLHTYAIFEGLYRRRSEKWLLFNAPDGELPSEEQLQQATALVLSGAACSAYDEQLWIRNFEIFLYDTYHKYKHLKFLTICFGLQVIIQAFGGKVEPFLQRKEDKTFYLVGNENLIMNVEEFRTIKSFQDISVQDIHVINKAHGDEITIIPENFINIGTSQSCKNEVLVSTDHRIFGYQGHPEFSTGYQITSTGMFRSFLRNKTIQEILSDESYLNCWKGANDKIHRDLCLAFLKN